MKKAIFITVRTGSSRLPNKALLEIQSLPTIVHLIRRVKTVPVDHIILCTTELTEDDRLCALAEEEGIDFFRGSTIDKLDRWRGAAEKYDIGFFVTADGDDLFCEPELLELGLAQFEKTDTDFMESDAVICGAFTYGIKVEALNKVCEIKDTDDTEMMWTYFKDTGLFSVESLKNPPAIFVRDDIRMTMDYQDDFLFFKNIIDYFFGAGNRSFSLRDIVEYLDEHPEVIEINSHLHDEWKQNQINKTNLSLKDGL